MNNQQIKSNIAYFLYNDNTDISIAVRLHRAIYHKVSWHVDSRLSRIMYTGVKIIAKICNSSV